MENVIPPSYEEATTKNHWDLVAGYITGPDLCAACLVCRRWHQIFAPWLWGNPASHFGTENDRVYVALTRFKRALPTASWRVRQLTHTLHLPPALSEIYNGPKPSWLRDVLEQLPNLQSLIVSQLPFFDHSALLTLRRRGRPATEGNEDEPATFPLRLLIAAKCSNATSNGLVEACLHLPHMVFLDLSWTTSARDPMFFYHLRSMRNLQVLKLRGIGLRDEDMELLAASIGIHARSLDVSNNKLTDASIDTLLDKCFSMKDIHGQLLRRWQRYQANEDWPVGLPKPYDPFLNQFRDSDLDAKFLKHLTRPGAGSASIEDLPCTGITHLYISNNFITAEGLLRLIKTENLCVLDAADIDGSRTVRPRAGSSFSIMSPGAPGLEKLAPTFERHAAKNLTYLRVHHSIVTEPTNFEYENELSAELDGEPLYNYELDSPGIERLELDNSEQKRHELDSAVPVYELPTNPVPCYELPASESLAPRASASSSQAARGQSNDQPQIKREAAYAPEVVDAVDDPPVQLSATGFTMASPSAVVPNGTIDNVPNGMASHASSKAVSSDDAVGEQISRIEGRRRQLRRRIKGVPRGLLPGALPALRALVLTDLPAYDDENERIVSNLKKFISDCALETQLAMSQATLEFPTLHVPGKPRYLHQTHRVRELFGLTHLILEMAPGSVGGPRSHRASSQSSNGSDGPKTPVPIPRYEGFHRNERSSTGDPDSEAFWQAQQNDFTFFGDEECGQPALDPDRVVPRSALGQKMTLESTPMAVEPLSPIGSFASPSASTPTTGNFPSSEGKDVVTELARWRREKKQASKNGAVVEGHWRGEIKVVRTSLQRRPTYKDRAY